MLNIKYIIDNKELVKNALKSRNFDLNILNKVIELGEKRGKIMFKSQQKNSQLAKLSKELSVQKEDKEKFDELKIEILKLKQEKTELNKQATNINEELNELLHIIPNIPLKDVPLGKDETMNVVVKNYDKLGRGLIANIQPHYIIAKKLNLFSIEDGTKMSGSRFVLYNNIGSKLIRALINFMLDLHTKKGYEEYLPPVLVKSEMLFGTGQLPKFEEDLFKIEKNNLYLIPTSEVPLTNIYNNEIVDLTVPKKMTAFTECFRSEAGSSGKDTKGIIRQHQFKKVELVKITNQNDAISEFEKMVEDAKDVLIKLEIPFREVLLCTGDLGFASKKTIDLELWLPSELKFREVSSISYMGDFQARRAMIRVRNKNSKETQYAHTMNGSGLAIDRLLAAIIENNYNSDGSITVPEALVAYMNGVAKIK